MQHAGHRGRLQHRVPDVAVGLVPERQRRGLEQQEQCRAELREREHGVDPLPPGEREQHQGEQERAGGEQVLPLDAPDAGRRRAATVAPDEVQDGERESREEAVRGEGGDEDADGGGVVARIGAVAVVVVGAGDEVGGLLELPPRALEYLPRHCVAATDAAVLCRSPRRSPGTEKRREHLIIGHGGSEQPVSWRPSGLLRLVLLPPLLLLVLFAICMPAFGSQ